MTAGIRIFNTLYVLCVLCSAVCYNKATITHHSFQEMTFNRLTLYVSEASQAHKFMDAHKYLNST